MTSTRVLHVLAGLHAGGIEQLALQLISQAPAGLEHHLLNTDAAVNELAPSFAPLAADGRLTMHACSRRDGPRLAWSAWRLCRRLRPDALLIYPCQRPMLWLALGARLAGVPGGAVHLGNPAPADRRGRRIWLLLLWLFARLGIKAVPCSQAIVASLRPLPPGLRLAPVIANGCDSRAIAARAARARTERPPGRRILMVARLDAIKDQATLLRAAAALAPRFPHWQLQLAGDGPERPRLEALARRLGLDPSAVFLGRRHDIPELLGQADLFAFSTTAAEGFGIALIEALAAGLPVLASDVPACREVLHNGAAGLLLPPGDAEAWRAALERLMITPVERQRLAQCSRRAAGQYDSRHCARRWFALLAASAS